MCCSKYPGSLHHTEGTPLSSSAMTMYSSSLAIAGLLSVPQTQVKSHIPQLQSLVVIKRGREVITYLAIALVLTTHFLGMEVADRAAPLMHGRRAQAWHKTWTHANYTT